MKNTGILYDVWLALLAVLLAACSLEYKPILFLSAVRTMGFLLFAMADLLCVLMLVTGRVSFGGLISVTEEKQMPRGRRGAMALRQLAAFLIGTVLFYVYCFLPDEIMSTNSTIDALVAGGLLCAATLAGVSRKKEFSC